MKSNDLVMATASLVLIDLLLYSVLLVAFASLNSYSMSDMLAYTIAFLSGSLIVGYVFALKIQEDSRINSIGSVVVLSSFALMFSIMIWYSNPLASPWTKDTLEIMFNTSLWTNYEWSTYSTLLVTLDVAAALLFDFIGLYIGSLLKKSAKNKK